MLCFIMQVFCVGFFAQRFVLLRYAHFFNQISKDLSLYAMLCYAMLIFLIIFIINNKLFR